MTDFTAVTHPGPPARDVRLRLSQVLVPMVWWRAIPMRRAVPVEMTPLERFALDLALTMGRAEPEDFTEVTGLPAHLLAIAARRLTHGGVLIAAGRGYRVVAGTAEKAAISRHLIEERSVRLDLVLLPRTGDLLFLDPRTSWLRAAERAGLTSVGNAPVPAELHARPLDDYIAERLRDGGNDITRAGPFDGEIPVISPDGWCPVFRGEGTLRGATGDEVVPHLQVTGQRRDDPVDLRLAGAGGLADHWKRAAGVLADPVDRARAWNELTGRRAYTAPPAERIDVDRWRCRVGGDDTRRLAGQGKNLARPLGLTVGQADLVAELAVELSAADPAAESAISLDRILTAAAEPGADTAVVPPGAAVRDRAWQLGFYELVYTLRAEEDFAYG